MRKMNYLILLSAFCLFTGCSVKTIYLQEADIYSSQVKQMARIAEEQNDKEFKIRASVIKNGSKKFNLKNKDHTKVDSEGHFVFEEDQEHGFIENPDINNQEFNQSNIGLKIPDIQAEAEIEYPLGKHLSAALGINFANTDNRALTGFSIGLGFVKAGNEYFSHRFDVIYKITQSYYKAEFVSIEENYLANETLNIVKFYNREGYCYNHNTLFSFSFNSKKSDWFINYFGSLSLGWQTFYDIEEDLESGQQYEYEVDEARFSSRQLFRSMSLGVFKDITSQTRVLAGARLSYYQKEEITTPEFFLQYDFKL